MLLVDFDNPFVAPPMPGIPQLDSHIFDSLLDIFSLHSSSSRRPTTTFGKKQKLQLIPENGLSFLSLYLSKKATSEFLEDGIVFIELYPDTFPSVSILETQLFAGSLYAIKKSLRLVS